MEDWLALSEKEAAKRGGQCLTTSHRPGSRPFFRFRCARDHVWDCDASTVVAGNWCHRCRRVERHFAEVQVVIEKRQGRVLGPFKNSRTPFQVECSEGHRWGARSTQILGGSWCARCAFDRSKHSLSDMQAMAAEKGGKCLSVRYGANGSKLEWQCAEGHAWQATPNTIQQGKWCPKCAGVMRRTIEEMRAVAASHGGECLSAKYRNGQQKLKWRCKAGHEWYAIAANVAHGAWCPICAYDFVRFTLEEVRTLARERGGKCLAEVYVNGRQKIGWQCKKGHVWKAEARQVSRGAWCKICGYEGRGPVIKIEALQAYAKRHGGRLLSPEVKKAHEPLAWKCAEGHAWLMSWTALKRRGLWCRRCAKASERDKRPSSLRPQVGLWD